MGDRDVVVRRYRARRGDVKRIWDVWCGCGQDAPLCCESGRLGTVALRHLRETRTPVCGIGSRARAIYRALTVSSPDPRAPTVTERSVRLHRTFELARPQVVLIVGAAASGVAAVVGSLVPATAGVAILLVPILASGTAAFALTVAAADSRAIDRAIRGWVAVAAWAWFLGHSLRAVTGTSSEVDGGVLPNALWIGGYLAAMGFGATVAKRLDTPRGVSLALDALAVTGAIILVAMVVVGERAAGPEPVAALLTILLPILTLTSLGLVVVAALARRWPLSLTGVGPAILGLFGFGVAWVGWLGAGPVGSLPPESPWVIIHAGAWLLFAHGVTTFREADRAGERWTRIAPTLQVVVPAVAAVTVAVVATFDDVFLPEVMWPLAVAPIALTAFAVITRQVLTTIDQERSIGRMSHSVMLAEIERRRADAARAAEGQRADMASLILAVSEDLRDPDSSTSLVMALRRIAPPGSRASIARLAEDRTAFTRIAWFGPGADGDCDCLRVTLPGDIGDLLHGRVVGRRADGGRPAQGIVASSVPTTGTVAEVRSNLTVPIRRADGWLLGALHFEDPGPERLHAPAFVALARSTANQLAGAMDNAALLERLRTEIAERDRVQAELILASRAKAIGELAGSVAHEVNNPLTGILGYAELLLEDLPGQDPRREDIEVIRDEAKRARAIVRALVNLAQNRSGSRVMAALDDVVGDAIRATRGRADAAGVVLTEAYPAAPVVAVDRSAIGAVVIALIDNAIAAMPGGGQVRLETTVEPDRALLSVLDTGQGMAPEVVRRAFDPFFSTHDARSGRGMGLAIALGVVRDHGGSIWIDSRLGEGTTVEVRLPLATPPAPIEDRDSASATAAAGRPAPVSTAFGLPDLPEEVMA